jgi:hypothetical protein
MEPIQETEIEHTSIPIDSLEESLNSAPPVPIKDFPEAPFSLDDKFGKAPASKKLKKKSGPHSRQRTAESDPIRSLPKRSRSYSQSGMAFIQNVKHIHIASPTKIIKNLRPSKLPLIQRFVKWGRKIWPGHPGYKKIIYSPYFFLYIISMSLIQAFVAGVAPANYYLPNGMDLSSVISLTFFILYLMEVLLRVSA